MIENISNFANVLSIIWYIFSIIFILYRFTVFFTTVYNFLKFCNKLMYNFFYFCNNLFTKRNSNDGNLFQRIKSKIFSNNTYIPLYDIRQSYIPGKEINLNESNLNIECNDSKCNTETQTDMDLNFYDCNKSNITDLDSNKEFKLELQNNEENKLLQSSYIYNYFKTKKNNNTLEKINDEEEYF